MKLPSPEVKWIIMFIFLVLAAIFMLGGLAVMRFRNWKRESGIVLLSATGFMAFAIFSIACIFMSEEFRAMMPPESMDAFSDYVTGSVTLAALATLGFLLVRADRTTATETPQSDGEDTAIQL